MEPAPFRWNLARRAELGRLVEGVRAASYPEMLDDLAECAARVVAICDRDASRFREMTRTPGIFARAPDASSCSCCPMNKPLSPQPFDPRGAAAMQQECDQH